MRWLPLILWIAACGGPTDDETAATPDPRKDSSSWPDTLGTEERPAMVFAPAAYDGESDLPLIMLLHGYGANGPAQDLVFQLAPRVDEFGFVLILPDGTEDSGGALHWNATDECCDFDGTNTDDSGYLAGLLDQAETAFPIDPDRVVITGHSNGGYMSYRMACDHSERLAGIASLAGTTFRDEADCKAKNPVSVLQIHGTADDTVLYEPDSFSVGAVESIERWADRGQCGGTTDGGTWDYEVLVDGKETVIQPYQGCDAGLSVELWTMNGVGHLPGFNDDFRDDLVTWLLAQRRR